VETGARNALVELHKLLALLETPKERREGADVHGVRQNRHKVVQNTRDFAKQRPNPLGPFWDLDVKEFFHSDGEALLVGHHGDVVQSVKVRQCLQICAILNQFLRPAVKQPNMWICTHDFFAIEFEDKAEHAVSGRVLRSEVDGIMPDLSFARITTVVGGDIEVLRVIWIDWMRKRRVHRY